METEEYIQKTRSNFRNNEYEEITELNLEDTPFDKIYLQSGNVSAFSSANVGFEKRVVGIVVTDDSSLELINDALEEIRHIAMDELDLSQRQIGSGKFKFGVSSVTCTCAIVTRNPRNEVVEEAKDRDHIVSGENVDIPIVVDLDESGLRGSINLHYPLPKRRHMGFRRIIKRHANGLFDV